MIPDVEIVELAEDVHVAAHRGGLAQPSGNQHPSLCIQLAYLPEVIHAIEIAQLAGCVDGISLSFCSFSIQTGIG